ncbi:MAG: tetratricopeptide repeat protein [Mangrovibacterium sp.]
MSTVLISSCSTKKNTFTSRNFHNLVSRYNIYFNGKEALLAGEKKIETEVADDYSRLLPVYKSSLPETENMVASNMGYAIEKGNKLISLHSITAKPKRRKNRSEAYKKLANKEEYNNWVDNSYILSGKAHYYLKDYIKAADEFDYVLRKFPEQPDVYYESLIWLLRCYTPMGMTEQAEEIIAEIEGSLQFPEQLNSDFDIAAANYFMEQNNYTQTIAHLEQAVQNTKNKKIRARCHYILAQLYTQDGQNNKAATHFQEVAHQNVSYPMRFRAQLSALELSANGDNIAEVQETLYKLLNSQRNQDYRDQIYYALAQTELRTHHESEAAQFLQQSAAAYIDNDNQLMLTCSTLSDLYYQQEAYIASRTYYDTLFTVLNSSHPDFVELTSRYKSLIRLTDNLLLVQREDSLQRLASMGNAERDQLISQWIIQKENENQLQEFQAQQQANDAQLYAQINSGKHTSSWYFYNPQTVNIGKQKFTDQWGKRRLEDNWRRSSKGVDLFEKTEDEEYNTVATDSITATTPRVNNQMDANFYTQDMPKTPEDWQASNDIILDALFRAGRIFKHDFENYGRSANTYEDLLQRFAENRYQLPVYFELWDSYTQMGNRRQTETYKQLILKKYAQSKYAKYLINPNYFIELEEQRSKSEASFEVAVALYQQGNYTAAAQKAKQTLAMLPDSAIIPGLKFIQLIGENKSKDKASFDASLAQYTEQYPQSDLSSLADNIRALLPDNKLNDYDALLASGYLSEEIYQQEEKQTNDKGFNTNGDAIHFFVITYDNDAEIDVNRLKFDVANYNIDHYLKTDFDIETGVLNAQESMLLVKTFLDKDQALIYLRSIIRKPEVFRQLHDNDYNNFVISSENLRYLSEQNNLDEYLRFYKSHYSQFTAGNFPDAELLSSEELMEKVAREKSEPKETGNFVLVNTQVETPAEEPTAQQADSTTENATTASFIKDPQATHLLVIAIKDKNLNVANTIRDIRAFHSSKFAGLKLEVRQDISGDYQLIIVESLNGATLGMNYFRQTIINRSLFRELSNVSYRNFMISSENFQLINGGLLSIDDYNQFFRDYYLSGEYQK